jgi:hypothetical protein
MRDQPASPGDAFETSPTIEAEAGVGEGAGVSVNEKNGVEPPRNIHGIKVCFLAISTQFNGAVR